MFTISVFKRCTKCGSTKPATREHWQRGSARDLCRSPCKDCCNTTEIRSRTKEQRFWRNLIPGAPDTCWEWQGPRTPEGYGFLSHARSLNRHVGAHRLSWELHRGPIPDGMWVLHKCDNPPCCNPAHLFLGTPTDNALDMVVKRRHGRGAHRRLTAEQVRAIRVRSATGEGQRALSRAFGVAQTTIRGILTGRLWANT